MEPGFKTARKRSHEQPKTELRRWHVALKEPNGCFVVLLRVGGGIHSLEVQLTKPYWQKLQDPRWQKQRLGILNRADFKCERCSTDDETLHVHHSYYERGVEPWEYPCDSLHCLCSRCHELRAEAERILLRSVCQLSSHELQRVAWALSLNIKLGVSGKSIVMALADMAEDEIKKLETEAKL